MSRGLLVLDFDGTMTDAEVEGEPFRGGYLEDVAALVDLPLAQVEAMARAFEAEVAADPGRFGWIYGGRVVAPATVDPYLRIMPVARKIMDATGSFLVEAERSRVLDAVLYKYNYTKTVTAFRPGAAELLGGLRDSGFEAYIVTNSHTEPVQRKVRELAAGTGALDWLAARVTGRARKYVIDASFETVPAELNVPGLERPILLRRRHYFEALSSLLERHGLDWEQLRVVGDIFELDLSLPMALGASVALVANPHTPPYEIAWLEAHPRGVVLRGLDQVRAWLDGPAV